MKQIALLGMVLACLLLILPCHAAFEVKEDQVIFRENDKVVKTLSLKPKTAYGDEEVYIKDKVFYDQRRYNPEYLLIYRDYNYLGDFCHTPKAKRIEVYDSKGNRGLVIDRNARIYVGQFYVFSKNWVVIINDAEGVISGYGFIHMKDKNYRYVSFSDERGHAEDFIHAFRYQTGYTKEKEVVWIISRIGGLGGREIITEIASDGSYKRRDVRFK